MHLTCSFVQAKSSLQVGDLHTVKYTLLEANRMKTKHNNKVRRRLYFDMPVYFWISTWIYLNYGIGEVLAVYMYMYVLVSPWELHHSISSSWGFGLFLFVQKMSYIHYYPLCFVHSSLCRVLHGAMDWAGRDTTNSKPWIRRKFRQVQVRRGKHQEGGHAEIPTSGYDQEFIALLELHK